MVAVLSASCRREAAGAGGAAGGAGGPGAMPAMPVVAIAAERRPVVESIGLVGTLAANEAVEVKTETDGIVQDILFEEGQEVKAGELLVKLDETKFKAELEEAQARLKVIELSWPNETPSYGQFFAALHMPQVRRGSRHTTICCGGRRRGRMA